MKFTDVIRMQRPGQEPLVDVPAKVTDDEDEKDAHQRLNRVALADLPSVPPPPSGQPPRPDSTQRFDAKTRIDAKRQSDAKAPPLDAKFDAKPKILDAKLPSGVLTSNGALAPNSDLTPNRELTPSKGTFPSWEIPRLFVRIPRELQDRLRFLGISKGLSLQDTVLLAIQGLLAAEGLTPSDGLTPNAIWRRTDQMIDDVQLPAASSIRPEVLLDYYGQWSGNQIREGDWKELRRVFSYSPLVVKAGILVSLLRKEANGGRVGSFKYCLGAIDEVAKAGVMNNEFYVSHLEMRLRKQREATQEETPSC